MATAKERWGIIYSPRAGSYNAHKRWDMIRTYIESRGVRYDFVQSEGFGSVERLAAMLCTNGYRTVVLVGGDGTLNDAINGILGCSDIPEDFAFAVIPNGIGNDFARFWGMGVDDYKRLINNIIERRTRLIDIGVCAFADENNIPQKRYFLNCINIGLGARLVQLTDEAMRFIGSKRLSTVSIAITQIFERKAFNVEFVIEKESFSQEVMSICIGNCHGYGQTPNAVPYNGLLDMSVITRPKWWQLFEGFWLLGKGHFLNYKNVHPYRTSSVKLVDAGKASISLDGRMLQTKYVGNIEVGVKKEFIRFII
ncbi:MAG: lipid kinase [Prevotellaceae bacterium]|nr:lipid kinase [Prevotellaceae bacterium]